MLAMLVCILKWIGIVLLWLLAVLTAVCLCILFVPVRYRIRVRAGVQWELQGRVSWLLHLVHVSWKPQAKHGIRIRIFGIPLSGRQKKNSQKKKNRRRHEKKRSGKGKTGEEDAAKTQTAGKHMELSEAPKQRQTADVQKKPGARQSASAEEKAAKPEISGNRKYLRILKKPVEAVKKIFLSIRRLFAKIKSLDSEEMELLRQVLVNGGRLLKRLLPRKMRGWIRFGTGDPAQTGQILGGLGIVFAMCGQGLTVTPDFEECVLEGECDFAGSLQGIVVLLLILRMHPLELIKRYM